MRAAAEPDRENVSSRLLSCFLAVSARDAKLFHDAAYSFPLFRRPMSECSSFRGSEKFLRDDIVEFVSLPSALHSFFACLVLYLPIPLKFSLYSCTVSCFYPQSLL